MARQAGFIVAVLGTGRAAGEEDDRCRREDERDKADEAHLLHPFPTIGGPPRAAIGRPSDLPYRHAVWISDTTKVATAAVATIMTSMPIHSHRV